MTAFTRILNIIHQYALHTLQPMLDQVPHGVRQEYSYWYGEEMLDSYHLEFQTLLWIPWTPPGLGNGGSLLMASSDHYELHSFRPTDDGVWVNIGPSEAEAVTAILHIYGATN